MDADSQDVQCDAEAFTDSPGQDSNHMMPTDRGPQSPSLPAKFEHFDAALVYAKGDCELAMGIQKKMNSCKLEKNMFPKVCLYDNPSFPASKMLKGEKVVKRCTLIFVVLTENTHDDMDVQALREEAFGLTRLAPKDELDLEKRYCVRPLHTKSEKDRKGLYKTPCGLLSIDSIDWYNYEKPFFQSKMKKLFEFFIPYRLKREQQDNGESPFQTAQLHGTQDINMDSMQGHLNMQSGQAVYQAPMNEAPGTVQGSPSCVPPAGRVSENHRQGPGHGNISAQEIPPSDQRWTPPSGNTPSHQDNLPNAAQSQGSWDQQHRISPALRSLNSTEDAHSSEAFQSLPEEDLVQDSKSESFITQGGQGERIIDNEDKDPYDSLTSAAPNREHPPPPYSPTSSLSATSRKTPLPDVSWISSQTEPGGGNPPCSGQEAHAAGDSQSGTVSLGDASGFTRLGPSSSSPPKGLPSDPILDQTGLDLGADGDSGLGLSDNSSLSTPDLGSASDFLEMVQSELSDGNSSNTGIGETTLPTADPLQLTPSIFQNPDMRRQQVYLDTTKTLLQQCDFLSESKCISDDSEID